METGRRVSTEVPNDSMIDPPLPHLTGEKKNVAVKKSNQWHILYVSVGFMIVCSIVYCSIMVATGVLLTARVSVVFRGVTMLAFVVAFVVVMFTINDISKHRKEDAA